MNIFKRLAEAPEVRIPPAGCVGATFCNIPTPKFMKEDDCVVV
jgi:hypothetical protein